MNLSVVPDHLLIEKVQSLVREERELLTRLLHLLREIEKRKLFADYGCASLHQMLVAHFGYSDDEAYRRISAMKLLSEVPQIETKVSTGQLSLSHLALARKFFRQEEKSLEIKLSQDFKIDLLEKISSKSLREAQRRILAITSSLDPLRPEKISAVREDKIEIRFVADWNMEAKILELQGLLAHQYPPISVSDLFEKLCDLGLEQWRPKTGAHLKHRNIKGSGPQAEKVRRIWSAAQFQCSNCKSKYALEIDHIFPRAKGGDSSIENLRILCRNCNQRSAIKHFGLAKMEKYLNKPYKTEQNEAHSSNRKCGSNSELKRLRD